MEDEFESIIRLQKLAMLQRLDKGIKEDMQDLHVVVVGMKVAGVDMATQTVQVETMGGAGTEVMVMILEDLRRLMEEDKKEVMDMNLGADQDHDPREDKSSIHLVVVGY